MSDSVRPHRWQPTRLPRPWDSPGKNTGVGCHFLLQCIFTLIPTSNSLANSVGFYQATLSLDHVLLTLLGQEVEPGKLTSSLFLSLSTLVRPKDVSHLATLMQMPPRWGDQIEE